MGEIIGYCETCGKQFKKYRSFNKYCCEKCRFIATERKGYGYEKKPIVKKKCIQCGKWFSTNNKKKTYCCKECYEEHQAIIHQAIEPDIRVCPVCGTQFESAHVSKKYCCQECYLFAKKEREANGKDTT